VAIDIEKQQASVMPAEIFVLANTAGAVIMVCPVTAGQIGIRNGRAGIGRMDKLSIPSINAHMRNTCGSGTYKENNVTGLQIRLCNICTVFILICGSTVGTVAQLA